MILRGAGFAVAEADGFGGVDVGVDLAGLGGADVGAGAVLPLCGSTDVHALRINIKTAKMIFCIFLASFEGYTTLSCKCFPFSHSNR
jgi:hypothetical protein